MYFFVRFTGIVVIIFGVLLMLLGFGGAIYGFVQNAALVDYVNNYILAATQWRLVEDVRIYSVVLGLLVFLKGMFVAGLGQLGLVFADIAANTRETNLLLRSMQRVD